MNYLLSIIVRLFLMISILKYLARADDVYYVAEFTDEIKDCDGFDNRFFKCNSLTVGFIVGEADEENRLGLSGKLDVLGDVIDDYTICLKVWKETDLGKEFMYTVAGNICGNLDNEDTPWWPLVKILNTTSCPIKQNVYSVQDMTLSLNFANGALRHEFVGEYQIDLLILDALEQVLSCHVLSVGIIEKTK